MESVKSITLQYIADTPRLQEEKPYRIRGFEIDSDDGVDLSNLDWEDHAVQVTDLRDSTTALDFDTCGFTWIDYRPLTQPTYDEKSVIAYCDDMIALLHRHVDAEQIICYDMRLRKNMGQGSINGSPHADRELPDAPIEAAHIDHSKDIGWARIAHHITPEEKDKYFTGNYRLRIYNIWKPLNPVIDDMPLAICDPRSVTWTDLVAADVIGPGFNAEVYYLRPQAYHRWYWMSKQTAEQLLLFLSWDSHPPSDGLNCRL
ncbi:MAG: hypothetical protein Q9172_007711 [Xanthocarpia lactea]